MEEKKQDTVYMVPTAKVQQNREGTIQQRIPCSKIESREMRGQKWYEQYHFVSILYWLCINIVL